MHRLALVLVAACSSGSSREPPDASPEPGEIDGQYLDARRGACFGGVGGDIRCSGSPCVVLDEPACIAAGTCFVAYTEDAGATTFRGCFPIDARSTAAGTCDTLAAAACVTRADCAGIYLGATQFGSFVRCEALP